MPTSTTNYELIKPGTDDPILIEQLNTNADIIDNALKENADALGGKVDKETGKGLSTNDFTTAEKTKLDDLAEIKSIGTGLNLDDNGELTATGGGSGGTTNYNDLSSKPQINGNTLSGNMTSAQLGLASASDIPTVPIIAIQKNGTGIAPVSGTVNITVPTTAADVSALPDTTKYAAALSLTINSSTYVVTGQLKDQNGDNLGTAQTIDLPLESVVVGGSYNSQTKKVVLTLQNGNTIEFSVADLVSGLQTELSASNKLNPAYINYDSTHRSVSDTEKSTWNGKQSALTTAQLAAANSGIDSAKVAQIEANKNNISSIQQEQLVQNQNIAENAAAIEEVDTALDDKVDKVAGKDLSTNDFTNEYKSQISANAVGIGAVAALGAKNNANFNFGGVVPNVNVKPGTIVCTEDNGVFSFSGAADDKNYAAYILKQFLLRAGTYRISGISGGSNTTYWMRIGTGTTDAWLFNLYDGEREFNLVSDTLITIQFVIYANQTVSNLIIKPMIRNAAIEDSTYVPYAPTNRELYEMILALQAGT